MIPSLPKNLPNKKYVRPEIKKKQGILIEGKLYSKEDALNFLLKEELAPVRFCPDVGVDLNESKRTFIRILTQYPVWVESVFKLKKELEEILK